MKKFILSTVAMTSLISFSSAFAADLPSHKAPPMMASVSPWQGVYAGINAGYGLNNINNYSNFAAVNPLNTAGVTGQNTGNVGYVGGAVAGAQVGYNHVFANHWMAGAELDFDWADVYNNTNPNQGYNYTYGTVASGVGAIGANYYTRTGMDWVGTVRARIGYDMGRFLPYITGGFAYGGLSQTINFASVVQSTAVAPTNNPQWNYITGSSSTVGIGWAAGAGAEYMVTDNWSVKGEYLFTSIGGISTPVQVIGANSLGNNSIGSGNSNTGEFGVHQVRAGLNYHTNWWGAAPVVAKY